MTTETARPPIDKQAILARYIAERDKRLRAEGTAQYQQMQGVFARYAEDPYTPREERAPKTDHVTFAFVGGGFAGLVTAARLHEAGITDVRIIEKGGDFGGTWYWNRYPGAQCDTASMVYMPLLEETGHMPTEKYAHAPEILAQCRRIGTQYGLYENALFHTVVTALSWDGDAHRWVVESDRGDRFTASHVGLGIGPLHVPKLPGIPGIADYQGHSFHTSRWDYDYTGGDPEGAPMAKLADKRVAIIGTGATSVQAVPHLAKTAGTLLVVQRTPSSIDVRGNRPIDPEWFGGIATPGWQRRWLQNFTENQTPGHPVTEDLVQDGWTDLSRRIKERVQLLPREERHFARIMEVWEDSDFERMEEIRARVDALVEHGDTAKALKAWYRGGCKRPCFHDAYLQAFNRPNVQLIDTDGRGVERITEKGFVVAGREYEVDCIIYASGFEVGTPWERRAGFEVTGRGGQTLSQAWGEGMRSKHGIHVHGFPNLYFVHPTQGANLISNIPHNLTEAGRTVARVVAHAEAIGAKEVEVTAEAQEAWVELLLTGPGRRMGASPDCTPGYYNNEGQPSPLARFNVGYPQGPAAYFEYLDAWTEAGTFEGLAFR